ncbi:hypothetical protein ACFCYH_06185 [Streptomyces sp. NPDC056400]|uniref:hypothetical protein n=1 Tax=unclassified Streptomyces TaxID=2593676 RepID=UPI0035DA48F4
MAQVADDIFEYVTYPAKREICPSCRKPIGYSRPARRGMLARSDGPPVVAYWHTQCVNPNGSR